MIGKALTLSPSLSLKYDLLLGPHNGVSRRIQRLVQIELQVVKVFRLVSWGHAFALETFLIVWLGLVVAI